jgi:hypothetical protein
MMKRIGLSLLVFITSYLQAGVDPMELRAQVSAMYMSKSPYCDSPVLVFSKDYVIQYNVFGFPVLGVADNGNHILDGTYSCLIFELSERFTFTTGVIASNCTAGTRYDVDVCTASHLKTQVDGATYNCSGAAKETVFLYLSTASNSNDPDVALQPFTPPTRSDASKGIKLDTPFSIYGNTYGRLIINGNNRVTGASGRCSMEMPRFSFVKE